MPFESFSAPNKIEEALPPQSEKIAVSAEAEKNSETPEQSFERVQELGNQYRSLLEDYMTAPLPEVDAAGHQESSDLLDPLRRAAMKKRRDAQVAFEAMQGDVVALLLQAFDNKELIDANREHIRLEVPAEGIYELFIDPILLDALQKDAQAFAVTRGVKVPFTVFRQFEDADRQRDNMEINRAHEHHHELWSALVSEGIIPDKQRVESPLQAGYLMFQEELIARCTGTADVPMGYSQLGLLSKEKKEMIEPEIRKQILRETGDLNGYLAEQLWPAMRSRGIPQTELVGVALDSHSHAELRRNLERYEASIAAKPITRAETPTYGW